MARPNPTTYGLIIRGLGTQATRSFTISIGKRSETSHNVFIPYPEFKRLEHARKQKRKGLVGQVTVKITADNHQFRDETICAGLERLGVASNRANAITRAVFEQIHDNLNEQHRADRLLALQRRGSIIRKPRFGVRKPSVPTRKP
jgi:hypothetical protein